MNNYITANRIRFSRNTGGTYQICIGKNSTFYFFKKPDIGETSRIKDSAHSLFSPDAMIYRCSYSNDNIPVYIMSVEPGL